MLRACWRWHCNKVVVAGLVPAIHVWLDVTKKRGMPRMKPGMTDGNGRSPLMPLPLLPTSLVGS